MHVVRASRQRRSKRRLSIFGGGGDGTWPCIVVPFACVCVSVETQLFCAHRLSRVNWLCSLSGKCVCAKLWLPFLSLSFVCCLSHCLLPFPLLMYACVSVESQCVCLCMCVCVCVSVWKPSVSVLISCLLFLVANLWLVFLSQSVVCCLSHGLLPFPLLAYVCVSVESQCVCLCMCV